jgi:hypothetical protein
VAAFFLSLFGQGGDDRDDGDRGDGRDGGNLDAQVLATALNVYATTLSLGGLAARDYGFTVNAYGLGAYSYQIGNSGTAFGVANRTTLNIYQILKAANARAVNGVLYGGDRTLRRMANHVFAGINDGGGDDE